MLFALEIRANRLSSRMWYGELGEALLPSIKKKNRKLFLVFPTPLSSLQNLK